MITVAFLKLWKGNIYGEEEIECLDKWGRYE
jgi:hypothetical protein